MTENWLPIPGYEGLYEVSNQGQVRSIPRIIEASNRRMMPVTGGLMGLHEDMHGYPRVILVKKRRKQFRFVHRLVAEQFIPNPDNKPFINHLDGVKTSNVVSNLAWVTASENMQHAWNSGLNTGKLKWIVRCPELNLETRGAAAMARKLQQHGFPQADKAGIRRVILGQREYLGLTFEAEQLIKEEGGMTCH